MNQVLRIYFTTLAVSTILGSLFASTSWGQFGSDPFDSRNYSIEDGAVTLNGTFDQLGQIEAISIGEYLDVESVEVPGLGSINLREPFSGSASVLGSGPGSVLFGVPDGDRINIEGATKTSILYSESHEVATRDLTLRLKLGDEPNSRRLWPAGGEAASAGAFTEAKRVSIDFGQIIAKISLSAVDGEGRQLVFPGNVFSVGISNGRGEPIRSSTTDFLASANLDFILRGGMLDGDPLQGLQDVRGITSFGVRSGFKLTSSELDIPDVLPESPYVVRAPARLELVYFWIEHETCVKFSPPEGRDCFVSPIGPQPDLSLQLDAVGILEMTLEEFEDQTFPNDFIDNIKELRFTIVPEPAFSLRWIVVFLFLAFRSKLAANG